MESPSFPPGGLRWAAVLHVACALLALGVTVFVVGRAGTTDVPALVLCLVPIAAVAAAALALPWRRWAHTTALTLAVAALALLLIAEYATGYAGSRQAAATYPLFVTLVLAWVGLTQPRRTALSFTVCVGAVLAGVVLSTDGSAIPLASLAVVLPAGAALGEAAAWIMGELRRLQRHDEARATTFIDLTRSLDTLPERSSRHEVATALAQTASRLFETRAAVTLLDAHGGETSVTVGRGTDPVDAIAGERTDLVTSGRTAARAAGSATGATGGAPGAAAGTTGPPAGMGVTGAGDERLRAGAGASKLAPDARRPGTAPVSPVRSSAGGVGTMPPPASSSAPVGRLRRTTLTLMGDRGNLGRVTLDLERDPDDAYLTNLLRLFAAQSAGALQRFELLSQLDHDVSHDELTGTGNRRHANRILATLRNGDGVILIDVDRFKSINDSSGHLAGDELLQALGRYLSGYVRGGDDVARLGGDEFVVLARGVGPGVSAAAHRLLDGWRTLRQPATVSIGVAVHRAGDEPSASLERADRALYLAKRTGRDQVGIDPDELVDHPL